MKPCRTRGAAGTARGSGRSRPFQVSITSACPHAHQRPGPPAASSGDASYLSSEKISNGAGTHGGSDQPRRAALGAQALRGLPGGLQTVRFVALSARNYWQPGSWRHGDRHGGGLRTAAG